MSETTTDCPLRNEKRFFIDRGSIYYINEKNQIEWGEDFNAESFKKMFDMQAECMRILYAEDPYNGKCIFWIKVN